MDTYQKQQFRKYSSNDANQLFAEKQLEDPQEEPGTPVPDEPIVPEQPDENPNPTSPEPGIEEPEKDDPTRIDEEPPIFNKY